jgi:hypothetical protein
VRADGRLGLHVWELPQTVRSPAEVGEYGATVARLAERGLNGCPVALVWDLEIGIAERAAQVLASVETVVAVADGDAEPALAELVARMLAERHGRVLLVASRVRDPGRWAGRAAGCLPWSRVGALLVARGRRPGGALGKELTQLAAMVGEAC